MSIRYLFTSVAALSLLTACSAATQSTPETKMGSEANLFQTSSNPKVESLLAEMTLDEKLAQISCIWFDKAKVLEKDGSFNPEKMKEHFPHGIGCWARPQDTFGMEDQGDHVGAVLRKHMAKTLTSSRAWA